jgi:arabinofuranosyltransferase
MNRTDATGVPNRSKIERSGWHIAFAIATLLAFLYLAVGRAWINDDAYITLRTVDNFINGYGLRWNVIERVQTYTHPLWMLLLSSVYVFTRESFFTTILLSLGVSSAATALLVFGAARSTLAGGLGVLVLAMSSCFIDYTSSGLENPLTCLLLVLFGGLFWRLPPSPKRMFWLSLVASLSIVNRMDTALLFLPSLALVLWQVRSWRALGWLLLGQIPFAAWEVFSIIYYGFPFPNTAYAKLNTGIPLAALLHQGLVYFGDAFQRDPILLVVIVLGLSAPFWMDEKRNLALSVGILFYLGYIAWIGGDFMGGRFFTVPMLLAVMLLCRFDLQRLRGPYLPLLLSLIFLGGCQARLPSWQALQPPGYMLIDSTTGIADERAFYYRDNGLLTAGKTEQAPRFAWRYDGEKLRRQGASLSVQESIGMVGYFGGAQVYFIDMLGLGDPLMARLPAEYNPRWRIGHFKRRLPVGYPQSVLSEQNQIADQHLAMYYDQLRLITRAPLFSARRWQAIWKMNTGQLDTLVDRIAYRY